MVAEVVSPCLDEISDCFLGFFNDFVGFICFLSREPLDLGDLVDHLSLYNPDYLGLCCQYDILYLLDVQNPYE